jgi:2-amino-4-hydroxy-6-hydroxymethyldihydropteridine diphosphokinase
MKATICYVALGSNLNDPRAQVLRAIAALEQRKNMRVLKVSKLYQTKPVGNLEQPDFINAVVKIEVTMSALNLLKELQQIEIQQGRVRTGLRNEPRIIDLDLLLYGNRKINSAELIVPHPRMLAREFVLQPLADVMQ